MSVRMTTRERLLFNSQVNPDTGWWEWRGAVTPTGYATTWVDGVCYGAHRVAYEAFLAPIPDDRELDHLCRNRGCINPHHLEPVTHLENLRRGDSPTARNARKTHCKHGHLFDAANTYHKPGSGYRQCRACGDARKRAYYEAKKQEAIDVAA